MGLERGYWLPAGPRGFPSPIFRRRWPHPDASPRAARADGVDGRAPDPFA